MTQTLRTALLAVVLMVVLPVLAACGDSDNNPSPSATAAAHSTAVKAETNDEKFVADYRASMPKESKDMPEAQIVKIARQGCALAGDTNTNAADAKRNLAAMMEHNGIRPNDDAVIKIWQLAVGDTCPSRKGNLDKVL